MDVVMDAALWMCWHHLQNVSLQQLRLSEHNDPAADAISVQTFTSVCSHRSCSGRLVFYGTPMPKCFPLVKHKCNQDSFPSSTFTHLHPIWGLMQALCSATRCHANVLGCMFLTIDLAKINIAPQPFVSKTSISTNEILKNFACEKIVKYV